MPNYLTQGLHRSVRQTPSGIATIFGERSQTWHELGDHVARLAGGLVLQGLRPGDRVAILALNSDRFIECYLAILWAGLVVSPLNTRSTVEELSLCLRAAEAGALMVDEQFAEIGSGAAGAAGIRCVINLGDGAKEALPYSMLLETAPIADANRCGSDLAMLLFTGGTTGTPKGVQLTHDNLAIASLGMSAMGCGTGRRHLHAVPLFHMAGIQMLFNHLLDGRTHVVMPAFHPLAALEVISRHAVDSLMLVPTMLQMMVEQPAARRMDVRSLKRVFYGASPISEAVLQRAMEVFPGAGFIQGYGMTESGITLMLPARFHTREGQSLGKLRSAGIAAPCAEVRIVDGADREVARGAAGEIVVKGPTVMAGYWRQQDLTAETLRGGWLHTGDIGYMDDEGFVFIVDRLKDMIVSGGENVYSIEVENILARHPAVAQCAVIGVPDDKWGERVHAVVVRIPGDATGEGDLMNHCRAALAAFKCPRSIEFRDALPVSAAGKLLKARLREAYWVGRDRAVS